VSPEVIAATPRRATVLDMDRYQWMVLFAAWLGWGFDIFDSLLFNYVAPTCVPVLLGIPFGTPAAAAATLRWTGILTSLLLVGWATGGIVFGRIADRLGRTPTLVEAASPRSQHGVVDEPVRRCAVVEESSARLPNPLGKVMKAHGHLRLMQGATPGLRGPVLWPAVRLESRQVVSVLDERDSH